MKAAVVSEAGRGPVYTDFPDPDPREEETIVSVRAAAVSPLALSRAAGRHYSTSARYPFVPGVDGAGRTPDGRRVFFGFLRPPYGSMAERAPVSTRALVDLPDGVDEPTAAAAALPGMSCWLPLTRRAPPSRDESVLVNGATGASGRMAVQVARHVGARSVIATGRDGHALRSLTEIGADELVPIGDAADEFRKRIRDLVAERRVGVILDYLGGPVAESILAAVGGPNAPRGPERVRFVQIGALAGGTIAFESAALRSSGLEVLGSGIGSSTDADVLACVREFLTAYPSAGFRQDVETRPLADVGSVWGRTGGARRLVFTVP